MNIRKNRRLRSSRKHLADLSMTPLIDVALTLLIMFMVATPIIHNAIKVTLPRGQAQESSTNNSHELIVYIDKNGDFYIDNNKIGRTDIVAHLKKIVGNDLEKTVYVKADTHVSYGTVLELVDEIKCIGGMKYVALATQKPTQTASSVA